MKFTRQSESVLQSPVEKKKLAEVSNLKSTRIRVVSLRFSVPDLLCNIGLSVSGLCKIRFNGYTLPRISTKKSFPKEDSRCYNNSL